VANTTEEARQLIELYGADATRVKTVHPGVDLSVFRPGSRAAARRALGLPADAIVLLFAGRMQPLKGPDILLRAVAQMIKQDPGLAAQLAVVFVGGPSGLGRNDPDMVTQLAAQLGISGVVRLEPPCAQPDLAEWYRAASVVTVPSHSESFGLVALEAQACGTPVVAAAVGGLRTAVRDGDSGVLVDSHDPGDYARVLSTITASPRMLARMSAGAIRHASGFGWRAAVDQLIGVYTGAVNEAKETVEA
jgi:D-inositol-3-phosphate glycosyltransferase